jgi:hypothetical protein
LGLPAAVESQDGAVLAGSARIVVTVDGEEIIIPTGAPAITRKEDWRVEFAGRAEGAGLSFHTAGWMEQDGMVLRKLNSPYWRIEHVEANLVRALELEGQRQKAMDLARRVFKESHLGGKIRVCDDYFRLLLLEEKPQKVLEGVESLLVGEERNKHVHGFFLHLHRARAYAAMGRWEDALAAVNTFCHLWATAEEVPLQKVSRLHLLVGWLLKGYIVGRQEGEAAAVQTWKEGYRWFMDSEGFSGRTFQSRIRNGRTVLFGNMLLSLSGEMTKEHARRIFEVIINNWVPPHLKGFGRARADTCSSVFTKTWRSPRGKRLARRIVFQRCSFGEMLQWPVQLFILETMRMKAFAGQMKSEEEDLVWGVLCEAYGQWMRGRVEPVYLLWLFSAWKGATGQFG